MKVAQKWQLSKNAFFTTGNTDRRQFVYVLDTRKYHHVRCICLYCYCYQDYLLNRRIKKLGSERWQTGSRTFIIHELGTYQSSYKYKSVITFSDMLVLQDLMDYSHECSQLRENFLDFCKVCNGKGRARRRLFFKSSFKF